MKYIISFFICISFFSCKEENNTPTLPINDPFDTTSASLVKTGNFVGSGHNVTGTASLFDTAGNKTIVLDPFSTVNGPDLKVYLSTDEMASSYVSLGPLKSISGKQSYDVPDGTNLDQNKFVLIWCEKFTVLFGSAELK